MGWVQLAFIFLRLLVRCQEPARTGPRRRPVGRQVGSRCVVVTDRRSYPDGLGGRNIPAGQQPERRQTGDLNGLHFPVGIWRTKPVSRIRVTFPQGRVLQLK